MTANNGYVWWDGAAQSTTTLATDYVSGTDTTYTTTYSYSAMGQLASAYIGDGRPRTVTFVTDLTGQVIRRDEADGNSSGGDPHEIFYRYGGRELGYTGNNGTLDTDYLTSIENRTSTALTGSGAYYNNQTAPTQYADFDQSLEGVNSYSAAGSGGYTVRAGDTLQSIAMQLWGDQALWYKLAEANGLGGSGGLTEGQSLIVPPGILASGHSSETFKPYDPAKALGDLSPSAIKPAKKGGCGMMGQILMIAIAVAVSAWVAPWATGLIVGQATGLGAVAGAALGGAIGGAAGSVASQVVGMATGNQSGFNWKGVGLAALGGAIGGGLGKLGALSQAGTAAGGGSGAAITGTLGKIGQFLGKGAFINDAAQGLLGNVLTQGIGLATGLQDKFSWAGVASAGIVAGVSGAVTRGLTPNKAGATPSFSAVQAGAAAGALAGAAARSLITGTNFGDNLIAVLPDVIGSTLGNMLVQGIQGSGSRGEAEPPAEERLQFAEASQPARPGQAVTASDGSSARTALQLIDVPLSLTTLDGALSSGSTLESLLVPLPTRLLWKAPIPNTVNHLDLRGGALSALVQVMGMSPGRELLITRADGKTVDTSGVLVSGYEAPYDGEFNLPEYKNGNNCYAYALNDPQSTRRDRSDFPQPGDIAGIDIRDYQSYDPETKATTIHLDRLEAAIRRDGRAGRVNGRDANNRAGQDSRINARYS